MSIPADFLPLIDDVNRRMRLLLPRGYRERLDDVRPTSMGSAGLRFDAAGAVAWDQIWGSFCELALAGGPPHRGKLLTSSSGLDSSEDAEAYARAAADICRGLQMVTGLFAEPAGAGSIRLFCTSAGMVSWLKRALTAENIAVRSAGLALLLPCGAGFRVEKEIKNVITATAKSCHYWQDHMDDDERDEMSETLAAMDRQQPLIEAIDPQGASAEMAAEFFRLTGLRGQPGAAPGWLEIECGTAAAAVWTMRLFLVNNILSRREETRMLVPEAAASAQNASSLSRLAAVLPRG